MAIHYQVLGQPGHDNALYVRVMGGHAFDRLLFDCGADCVSSLEFTEIQAIEHVFFSHLHMDHVAGFDAFFRATYDRVTRPNVIWGPPNTARIMQHRFQGFLWNLYEDAVAMWYVHDIHPHEVRSTRYQTNEAFAHAHDAGRRRTNHTVLETAEWTLEAYTMDHGTPSIAYVLRERPRVNVDVSRLPELGLKSGPWLRFLKEAEPGQTHVEIAGVQHDLETLRAALLTQTPGDSIAYLTDFRLDENAMRVLEPALRDCRTVVCESQYRHADRDLAERNHHMTTTRVAELAARARVGELVLFHLSDRYTPRDWHEMLLEARSVFSNARFPAHWTV